MLRKLFGARKLAPIPNPKPNLIPTEHPQNDPSTAALKIIHAGGHVELYYMVVPAARIIGKHPSFMLARPEVFHRPWEAIVGPEEILGPGEKYFVVPHRTVRKLTRWIQKQIGNGSDSTLLQLINSQSSIVENRSIKGKCSEKEESFSRSSSSFVQNRFGILIKSKSKIKVRNRRVRFFGINSNKQEDSSVSLEKSRVINGNTNNKTQNQLLDAEKRRSVRSADQWQPKINCFDSSVVLLTVNDKAEKKGK